MLLTNSIPVAVCFLLSALSYTTVAQAGQNALLTLVYQFAAPKWIENIAVRPNGNILSIASVGTGAVLNQINPRSGQMSEVYDFSSAGNSIQGITSLCPDLFVLNVLNCSLQTLGCTNGSTSTWLVAMGDVQAEDERISPSRPSDDTYVKKLVDWPEAGFLNGIAALNPHIALFADSFLGGIWSLDIRSRKKQLLFTDLSMQPLVAGATGLNGIRVRPRVLYFTNSALATFNSISIDPKTGQKTGNATVITRGLVGPDDFEVNEHTSGGGTAYLANGVANQLLAISLGNGTAELVADVPGPTSVRWAGQEHWRDGKAGRHIYISTVGGLQQYIDGNFTLGGAVYKANIDK
ncbi:hypothetical protein BDV96DRAFT_588752 [Lophiotrema nucula]|uniref:SMP-30/Gluconolactonase/LRE-like region domain-containing protein n=1 Tax=Lophiotrema nucula TaxID=690887 RepID=A0A6A5YNM3_9PLEO|nr:hypothetical protein BDV96DRAFT_588752 [Lophiotrema nucula]